MHLWYTGLAPTQTCDMVPSKTIRSRNVNDVSLDDCSLSATSANVPFQMNLLTPQLQCDILAWLWSCSMNFGEEQQRVWSFLNLSIFNTFVCVICGKNNHRWAELQNNCVRWRRHDWWEICARTIWSCIRSDSNSNLIIKYIELKESVIDDFYLGSFFPSFSNFCLQNVNVFSDNFNLLFVSFCLLLNFLEIVFCFGNVCWISRQIWNFVFDGLLGEALNRISALLNH